MIGIYKIINNITKEIYIGQSTNIKIRWAQHKRAFKNNEYPHLKIYQAFKKYGLENFSFEVIEQCEKDELNEREQYWIKYYNSYINGYNMTPGGAGDINRYDTKGIQKMWDEGYRVEDIKEVIGCSISTIHSKLHNYKDFNYSNSKLRNFNYLQQHEQNVQPISLRTPIYQYELNGKYVREFNSVKEAAAMFNKQPDNISMVLSGKRKTAFGYFWSREKKSYMPPIAAPNGKVVKNILTGIIYPSINTAARENNINANTIKISCEKRKNKNENLNSYDWEYI